VTTLVGLYLVGVVVVLIFAVIGYFIWDQRYRGGGGDAFKPTGEVFRDPTSGKMTRVYEDPKTGQRQYREES
jgi:hypothetical protein